jgi:branched-chain amino acid transport system substrate-binding protein
MINEHLAVKKMSPFNVLGTGMLALLFVTACSPKENVVKIAVAVPLTGDTGTEGQGLRRAVEMAIEEANAANRFPYKLAIVPFDDRADPKEAVNVANLIISDPSILAVIGPYNSGCAIPAAKVYARAPVAMVTPAATNPEVTAQQLSPDWSGPRVVFRLVPTDLVQGSAGAKYVFERLSKREMAIIHDKTPYGQGLSEQFRKTFIELGGRVVSVDGVGIGDKDFKSLLTKIKNLRPVPKGIYFGGLYTEAGLLLKQMKELGMESDFIFMSGDGAKISALFDVAGNAAEGAYLSIVGVPVEDLPTAQSFIENYKKRWTRSGEVLEPFDHFSYEAAQIIMDALERAGVPDRQKILEQLPKTKHTGVIGETIFDAKGDTQNTIVTITQAHAKDRTFTRVH